MGLRPFASPTARHALGLSMRPRHVPVAPGDPVGNLRQHLPHALLKRGALQAQGQLELAPCPGKVFV